MKILNISQDSNRFVMKVKLNDGGREFWSYERTVSGGLVSYSLISREDA